MVVISRLHPKVIKICRPLIVEDQVLKLCVRRFFELLEKSLTIEKAHESSLKCWETHILDFPNGSEKGKAIGLDISGRIFRLVLVHFRGDRSHAAKSRLYEIPEAKLRGSGFKVVEYIARCVANFLETSEIKQDKIVLGVSIGFPVKQESLQEARILQWNDDFSCDDFLNEDFFNQLKLALKKYKTTRNLYLISATTDAASCLFTGMYKDPLSKIGVVIGDQISLCYLEKLENITVFSGDGIRTRTAVNVDFRSFGDDGCLGFIKTEFDDQVDADSKDRGRHTLDKLISGKYLGEIFRLCLIKLITEKNVLDGLLKPKLKIPGSIRTEDIAFMEKESEKEFNRCRIILHKFGYEIVTDEDCCQVRFAARCVIKRSAHLLAAFLTAVINHLQMKETKICVDGSILRQFPDYYIYLRKRVDKLKRPEVKYSMILNEKDDLGLGAGLLAHIYKDGIIKVEEKYRVLPPLKSVQAEPECKDCEAESRSRSSVVFEQMPVISSKI